MMVTSTTIYCDNYCGSQDTTSLLKGKSAKKYFTFNGWIFRDDGNQFCGIDCQNQFIETANETE